jgi:hypothetical protein
MFSCHAQGITAALFVSGVEFDESYPLVLGAQDMTNTRTRPLAGWDNDAAAAKIDAGQTSCSCDYDSIAASRKTATRDGMIRPCSPIYDEQNLLGCAR